MRIVLFVLVVLTLIFGVIIFVHYASQKQQDGPVILNKKAPLCDWNLAMKASKDRTGSHGLVQVVIYECNSDHYEVYLQDRGQEYPVGLVDLRPIPDRKIPTYPIKSSRIMDVLFNMKYPPTDDASLIARDKDGKLLNMKARVIID